MGVPVALVTAQSRTKARLQETSIGQMASRICACIFGARAIDLGRFGKYFSRLRGVCYVTGLSYTLSVRPLELEAGLFKRAYAHKYIYLGIPQQRPLLFAGA